jgi:pentapeptide repeat protein
MEPVAQPTTRAARVVGFAFFGDGEGGMNRAARRKRMNRARRQAPRATSSFWERLWPLMVSLVVLFAGFSFGFFSAWALQEQDRHAQAEHVLEDQRVQEATLDAYRAQMNTYLLEEGLGDSEEGDRVRKVARMQTLTVLGRLGPEGKGSVVLFLYKASLIDKEHPIIDLHDADLSEAELGGAELRGADLGLVDLSGAELHGADLSEVNLFGVDLYEADLEGADLSGADLTFARLYEANLFGADLRGAYLASTDLSEADLSEADLSGADLTWAYLWKAKVTEEQLDESRYLKGAIMPDGRRHS